MQKQILPAAILCILCAEFGTTGTRADEVSTSFLRINEYYVLYTRPTVPHIDKGGNLIVGLQGLAALSSRILIPNDTLVTKLSISGHDLGFKAHSRIATVDGSAFELPIEVELDAGTGQLLVPVAAIFRALNVKYDWDAALRVCSVDCPGLLVNAMLQDGVSMANRHEEPSSVSGSLQPVSVRLSNEFRRLRFQVVNRSARAFPSGSYFINLYSQGWGSGQGIVGLPFPPDIAVQEPALAPNSKISTDLIEDVNGPDAMIYSLGWMSERAADHGEPAPR